MIKIFTFTTKIDALIDQELDLSKSFKKKHVYGRFAHAIMIPLEFTAVALNILSGLGNGFLAICTGGKKTSFYTNAVNHLNIANYLLSQPFFHLLRTINPEAKITPLKSSAEPGGLLTGYIKFKFLTAAGNFSASKKFFKHHVASRLTYALMGIACLITRTVEGIIGLIAATCAIITGGKITKLNVLATKGLQASAIIADLWFSIMHTLAPTAINPTLAP